ncbi:MAG: fluoride efflux transporter CrcB [Chloroflexota bacterium]|nr:fluoride efflux transporter CrcB [Chloroflexota bacterium]
MSWLLVGIGGGIGAMLRFGIGRAIPREGVHTFPTATFAVNLTGAFLIGLILGAIVERNVPHENWRLLLVVGLLGGYTTFSAFAWETISLIEANAWRTAALYVVGTNLAGLAACAAGLAIARLFIS